MSWEYRRENVLDAEWGERIAALDGDGWEMVSAHQYVYANGVSGHHTVWKRVRPADYEAWLKHIKVEDKPCKVDSLIPREMHDAALEVRKKIVTAGDTCSDPHCAACDAGVEHVSEEEWKEGLEQIEKQVADGTLVSLGEDDLPEPTVVEGPKP